MVDKHERNIQQVSIALPYFHQKVPLLCLEDGTPYIPVAFALQYVWTAHMM